MKLVLSQPALAELDDILRYVIFYEIGGDAVTVLRILHGSRRPPWDED